MSHSATCSDPARRRRVRGCGAALAVLLAAAAPVVLAASRQNAEAALSRLFPPPLAVEKKTAFLDASQVVAVEKRAGQKLPTKIYTYYVATDPGTHSPVGWAYIDTHIVRTLPETLLVVLDAGGSVREVEILSFNEPPEYLPSAPWIDQFEGRVLDDELRLQRGIRTLAGATLSSVAMTDAVRRVLAIHEVLEGEPVR